MRDVCAMAAQHTREVQDDVSFCVYWYSIALRRNS